MNDELRTFHNRLRILINIDMSELVNAGIISSDDTSQWIAFRDNPWRWFIRAEDEQVSRVWKIVEHRENGLQKIGA